MASPDLSVPRYPQDTFNGRFWHFLGYTAPRNFCPSEQTLLDAKNLVEQHAKDMASKTPAQLSPLSEERVEDLWRAKYLIDSSYHPDTGELVNVVGRMSSHIPVCTVVCGAMLHFRHGVPAMLFWQWANQSVNALVNYCNRNGTVEMTPKDLAVSYTLATGSAWALAIGLNYGIPANFDTLRRLIPFFASALPGGLNVGFMRQKELREGLSLYENSELSRKAATKEGQSSGFTTPAQTAVLQTWGARVGIAGPSLAGTAIIMSRLEAMPFVKLRAARLTLPLTVGVYWSLMNVSVPFGLSLWPQVCEIRSEKLTAAERAQLVDASPRSLFFNKGL